MTVVAATGVPATLPLVQRPVVLGAAALALLALGLLVLLPGASAQGASVNMAQVQVGLESSGDIRYLCPTGGSCSAILNDNVVRITWHSAGGAGDYNVLQGSQWGISYTEPGVGFRTAPCAHYTSGDGACAPYIGTAYMGPTGFSFTGAAASASSITAGHRWAASGSPAGPVLVQHVMKPSAAEPHLAEVKVTFTNTDATKTVTDVHYRRAFVFEEQRHPPGAPMPGTTGTQSIATYTKLWIEGDYTPPDTLVCSSNVGWIEGAPGTSCVNGIPDMLHSATYTHCEDDGRMVTHPTSPPVPGPATSPPKPGPGYATSMGALGLVPWTAGPTGYIDCGQGAVFEFTVGDLAPGQSRSFTMYLGAVLGTSARGGVGEARAILRTAGVDAEFWAIGEPGTVSNTTWATAIVGFQGLYRPTPTITWTTFTPGWTVPAPFTAGVTVCLGHTADFSALLGHYSYPLSTATWNFGDSGTASFSGGSAPGLPVHMYAAAGTYTVTLTITDTGGWSGSASATVTVRDCHVPPVAAFTISGGGADCVDSRVFFNAVGSSDPDGGPVTYSWNFGDGSPTATGASAVHQYANDNPVTVTLTVTDDEGATTLATQPYPAPGDPNCPPDLDPLPEAWVTPGEVFVLDLHAVDQDGPTLTFEGAATLAGTFSAVVVTPGPPNWDATGKFTFTVPAWPAGRFELPFRASDGKAYDEEILVLRIRGIVEDTDHDGVADPADNCPGIVNLDQADSDHNGVGDACQGPDGKTIDQDGDGVPDTTDLCPTVPDPKQEDSDADGIGDACERLGLPDDADADGWLDRADNCPVRPNLDQKDLDHDGDGDVCDPDADGDGVADAGMNADNCLGLANHDQLDTDQDGKGNACDDVTDQPATLEERKRTPGVLDGASGRSILLLVGVGPAVMACLLLLALWRRKRKEQDRQ